MTLLRSRVLTSAFALTSALVATASTGAAQTPSPVCTAQPTQTQDACQKAVDLFSYVAPSLGTMITGGNATLGQVGTIGRPGHFSFGLRVVGMAADLPQLDDVELSTSGMQQTTFTTKRQWAGFPTADLAIGVFPGMGAGIIRIPSVDALVNLSYLPKVDAGDYTIDVPDGSFKAGLGARIGLINESGPIPAVAFTFLRRDLPTLSLTGGGLTTSDGDSVFVHSLQIKTSSWRITAGKKLAFISAVVGMGQDTYKSHANVEGVVAPRVVPPFPGASTGPVDIAQTLTRTNMFANLKVLFLNIEAGRVSGGNVASYNSFSSPDGANAARTYFSTGVRFGF